MLAELRGAACPDDAARCGAPHRRRVGASDHRLFTRALPRGNRRDERVPPRIARVQQSFPGRIHGRRHQACRRRARGARRARRRRGGRVSALLRSRGHRGTRGLRPENTLAAFGKALQIGVTTLELDTGVTKDGVVVVSHERRISSLECQGPYVGKLIKELTLRADPEARLRHAPSGRPRDRPVRRHAGGGPGHAHAEPGPGLPARQPLRRRPRPVRHRDQARPDAAQGDRRARRRSPRRSSPSSRATT